MAVYRIEKDIDAKGDMMDALRRLGLIADHIGAWDVGTVSIVIKNKKFELTTENPLPPDELAHLGLIEV